MSNDNPSIKQSQSIAEEHAKQNIKSLTPDIEPMLDEAFDKGIEAAIIQVRIWLQSVNPNSELLIAALNRLKNNHQ